MKSSQNVVINDRRRDAERHSASPDSPARYFEAEAKISSLPEDTFSSVAAWQRGSVDPASSLHSSSLSPSEPTGSEQAHRGGDRAGSPCTCSVLELARACSSMLTHTRHVHVTTHWCHVTSRLQTLHFGLSVTFLDMMDRSDTSVAQTVDSLQTSNFMHV